MARWAGESLRLGVAQGALERRNFLALVSGVETRSNELVANWAEWESIVSEMVFCCAWIRSSF